MNTQFHYAPSSTLLIQRDETDSINEIKNTNTTRIDNLDDVLFNGNFNSAKSNASSSIKQLHKTNSKDPSLINIFNNKETAPSPLKRLITTGKEIISPSAKQINNTTNKNDNSSRSSFKLSKATKLQDIETSKREITFRFKKNRSLSQSYTTGYDPDIDIDFDDEQKKFVDEDDSDVEDDEEEEEEEADDDDKSDEFNDSNNIAASKLSFLKNKINNSFLAKSTKKALTMENIHLNTLGVNGKTNLAVPDNDESNNGQNGPISSTSTSSSSSSGRGSGSGNTTTDNNSSSLSNLSSHNKLLLNDLNNNINHKNHNIKNSDEDLNDVIVLDDANKKIIKRGDSIRMRHYSNISTNTNANLRTHINLKDTDDFQDESNNNKDLNANEGAGKARLFRLWKRNNSSRQKRQNYLLIFLLFVVNLLNYIDRFTLAGVLPRVQKYFKINDGESGLLQTVFICSYMLLAPLFGYLGDRYSRKWIIIFGITFWSLMTFLGSFIPEDKFWLFAIIRSLVGIGEASYSCVAPTIIGDLFTNELRTRMLAFFYVAVPFGSGLGYIVGSEVADIFDDWRWSLRITPPLGLVCIVLLVFVFKDPKRGGAEGTVVDENKSTISQDLIYLIKNKTFIWVTLGFTFASFVLGGLSWWVPAFVEYAILSNEQKPNLVSLKFGVVTCISGLLGVTASSFLAAKLRTITKHADPLVCALGSLIAVPSLFFLILITRVANQILFWFLAAVAVTALCLCWTIVADILLYCILPSKRSTASAFNILICHLLGDAGSPYVIGLISDALRAGKPDTFYNKFTSLQLALYAGPFFAALSFACYLFAAIYVEEDKKKVDDFIRKNQKSLVESTAPTQLSSSNELTSNENSQRDDNDNLSDIRSIGNSNSIKIDLKTNNNKQNSNVNLNGKSNENFTDSKNEISIESTKGNQNLHQQNKNN